MTARVFCTPHVDETLVFFFDDRKFSQRKAPAEKIRVLIGEVDVIDESSRPEFFHSGLADALALIPWFAYGDRTDEVYLL